MKIETKFNIGDKVYYMYDNNICKGTVDHLSISITRGSNTINYFISTNWYKEKDVYKTKDDIIEKLIKRCN